MINAQQYKKRFALIGNCQTIALCKYIRELPDGHRAFWICPDDYINHTWIKDDRIFGSEQVKFHIFDDPKKREIIQTSDVLIYQPNFTSLQLISANSSDNQFKIGISPILLNNKKFMIEKEEKYNTKIKISEIIKKHKDKVLYIQQENHPSTFLYLEILKEICSILGVRFFNQQSYDEIMKTQYPNY